MTVAAAAGFGVLLPMVSPTGHPGAPEAVAQPPSARNGNAAQPAPVNQAVGDDAAALERLQHAYLMCDREATARVLASGEAQLCSQTAEALLQRGFGGDFDRLLAWWRTAKLPPVPAQPTTQRPG